MATKISGIKGINISKSSVLNDGGKKSNTNDSFRDTANGTTRDNSGNHALDAATIKMLLGQTELMAKKAQQIEQNMRMAQEREEERQKQLAERIKEKEKREAERKDKESERTFNSYYDKIDKGIINGALAQFIGPAGVLLGKGLNTFGVPLERWGKTIVRKGVGGLFGAFGGGWGRSNTNTNETENALSVNRREEAAEPVNKLRTSINKRLDRIIELLGGKKAGSSEGEKKQSWLSRALSPVLGGVMGGLLGRLLGWLAPKLALLAGITALGYGLHKLWDWANSRFGPNWANGIVKGTAEALKPVLQGVGKGIQSVANVLKKGAVSAKVYGALGKVSKTARAASIAAQKSLQAGQLTKTGKFLLGTGKTLSKVGKAAGIVGNLVIAGEAGYDAYNKFKAGDKRGGYGAIGRGAGSIAGGSLGMWGGAAAGAAIGSVVPGIGTAIGGLIGGILGAVGGGFLGSKAGEKVGEYGYDLLSGNPNNTAVTEGQMVTETPSYSSLLLQNESVDMQKQILGTLRNIEFNLNPQIQKDLDDAYIENIKRSFDKAPEVNTNYFEEYSTLRSGMMDDFFNRMKENRE